LIIISQLKINKIKEMKKNMGTVDKTIRLIVAILFAGLYFGNIVTGTVGLILVVLGAVFVLTSLISFCPLYLPFGINTCKKKD
jgi:hypothetical protein